VRFVLGIAGSALSVVVVVVVVVIVKIGERVADVFELNVRRFVAKSEKMYMDRPDKLRKSYLLKTIMDEGTYGFF